MRSRSPEVGFRVQGFVGCGVSVLRLSHNPTCPWAVSACRYRQGGKTATAHLTGPSWGQPSSALSAKPFGRKDVNMRTSCEINKNQKGGLRLLSALNPKP